MIRRIAISLLALGASAAAITPADFSKLVERLEALPRAQADSLVASMLTDAEALTDLEQTARELIFNSERPDDINERAYGPIARAIAASPLSTASQRAIADWEAHAVELNAPGTVAADFTVRRLGGGRTTIGELTAGAPAMLYFYNPDCHHCMETPKRLRGKTMPAQVFAICVDSTDKRWRDTAGQLPDDWVKLLDVTDVQAEDLYIFMATPAIYLLDADGRVTAKNPPIDTLAI